jgi:hypothetical protein
MAQSVTFGARQSACDDRSVGPSVVTVMRVKRRLCGIKRATALGTGVVGITAVLVRGRARRKVKRGLRRRSGRGGER